MESDRLLEIIWSGITDGETAMGVAEIGILLLLHSDTAATAKGSTMSVADMMARLQYKRANSVRDALAKLVGRGLVEKDVRQGKVGTYRLRDPALAQKLKRRVGVPVRRLKIRRKPSNP